MTSSCACASHFPQFNFSIKSLLTNQTYFCIFLRSVSSFPFTILYAKIFFSTLMTSHIRFCSLTAIAHCLQTIVMIVTQALAFSLCISISSICIRLYHLKTKSTRQSIVIICTQIFINIDDCTIQLLLSGVDVCIIGR